MTMPARISEQILVLFGALLCAAPSVPSTAPNGISGYRVRFGILKPAAGGREMIILRQFGRDGSSFFLGVDPDSLATEIVPAEAGELDEEALNTIRETMASTPYIRALNEAEAHSQALQDAGISHLLPAERGVSLTIDLCPSRKPLDRALFRDIAAALAGIEKPAPLAISVSGVWMEDHPDDLRWLLGLIQAGDISVDWINHTYHHRYDPKRPLRDNFLLEKGTDLEAEILLTEKKMIENRLVPSAFFRFPGLVSDTTLFKRVTAFGLIPVGSDAWLAKGQAARPGSIVLIHGNGNEPLGVKEFLDLLAREKTDIKKSNWLLFDLRDGVAREEKIKR